MKKFAVKNKFNEDSSIFEVHDSPLQLEIDENYYEIVSLKNGLKALLISDIINNYSHIHMNIIKDKVETKSKKKKLKILNILSESTSAISPRSTLSNVYNIGCPSVVNQINNFRDIAFVSILFDVGYFHDPKNFDGLSHLLEHLTFMGSEKYPLYNEFETFILKSGGRFNAVTECENTVYYFNIDDEYLEEALDRFTELICKPILTKHLIKQETHILESEFKSKMQDDVLRREHIIASMAKSCHPCSKFGWGDLRTLKINIDTKDPNDELLLNAINDFRLNYYTADRMFVCIQSNRGLKALKQLLNKFFSKIPTGNRFNGDVFTPKSGSSQTQTNSTESEIFSNDISDDNVKNCENEVNCNEECFEENQSDICCGSDYSNITLYEESEKDINIFKKEFYENIIFVLPVLDINLLEMTWCMPPVIQDYKCKPHQFVTYLLIYEGCGSLIAYLRNKHWATELDASFDENISYENNSFYFLYKISVYLTDEGIKHIKEIIEVIFAYLKLLEDNGPDKDQFNELRSIYEIITSTFLDICPIELVYNLKYYPSKDVLIARDLLLEYTPSKIEKFLQALLTTDFNIMITSKNHIPNIVYDKKEKWFGTKYGLMKIPEEWFKLWKYNDRKFQNELSTRNENKFILNDINIKLQLVDTQSHISDDYSCEIHQINFVSSHERKEILRKQIPMKIFDIDVCELWFIEEEIYENQPKYVNMCFNFITPLILINIKNELLLQLWLLMLEYNLSQELSLPKQAGYNFNMQSTIRGFCLQHNFYFTVFFFFDLTT